MASVSKNSTAKKSSKRTRGPKGPVGPLMQDIESLSLSNKPPAKRRIRQIENTTYKPVTTTFRSISQPPRSFSPIETPSGRSPHYFGRYKNQSPDVELRPDTPPIPVDISAHHDGVLVLPNRVRVTPIEEQSSSEQSSIGDSEYGFYDTEFKGGKKRKQKKQTKRRKMVKKKHTKTKKNNKSKKKSRRMRKK